MKIQKIESLIVKTLIWVAILVVGVALYFKFKAWSGTPFLILPAGAIAIMILIKFIENNTGHNLNMDLPILVADDEDN